MCCGLFNLGKPNKKQIKHGECAVCIGMDNNRDYKQVEYCYLCKEWICEKCENRLFGRGWMALKKLFQFG